MENRRFVRLHDGGDLLDGANASDLKRHEHYLMMLDAPV